MIGERGVELEEEIDQINKCVRTLERIMDELGPCIPDNWRERLVRSANDLQEGLKEIVNEKEECLNELNDEE